MKDDEIKIGGEYAVRHSEGVLGALDSNMLQRVAVISKTEDTFRSRTVVIWTLQQFDAETGEPVGREYSELSRSILGPWADYKESARMEREKKRQEEDLVELLEEAGVQASRQRGGILISRSSVAAALRVLGDIKAEIGREER